MSGGRRGGWGAGRAASLVLLLLPVLLPVGWAPGVQAQSAAPEITSAPTVPVNENATAVATLTATDTDTDTAQLTWSIPTAGGVDDDAFSLTETGVLTFTTAPDHEDPTDTDEDNVYEVTVQVSDGTNTTTANLEVTVGDVAPGLSGPATASHAEGKRGLRIATYTVDDGATWSLTGDDAAQFTINGGFLRFVDPPDFENASDSGADNVYNVTIQAGDGTTTETAATAVTVANVDKPGAVTLSPLKPKLGTALTATLADPDGVSGTPTWQWERNDGREGWEAIDGATAASYTPTAADGDRYLRATATYTDELGSGRTAQAMASHVVIAHRLSSLSFTGLTGVTRDNRAFYPAFDRDTLHYAARCTESVTLTLNTEDTDTRLSVNGVQRPKATAFTVDGLDGESDIRIRLSGSDGAATTYTVHCIDRQEFPKLTTVKNTGAMEDLAQFKAKLRPRGQPWRSYLIMMDNNGVPRLRLRIADNVYTYFRVHPDETNPHARYSFTKYGSSYNPDGVELVVLDKYFNVEADDIHILSPFSNTDGHDQMVLENGNYVLMAYSPNRRDLRFINDALPGVIQLTRTEPVRDSVIQMQTADGMSLFDWNAFDHLAIEDCIGGSSFRSEYGHINSLSWIDGDIVAGFRHCSKILCIDVDTGDVVWRAGPSLYSRAEWEAGETIQSNRGPAPLDFVNDPAGGFSGQHGGQFTRSGNLLVYDNSTHCDVPPGFPDDAKGLTRCNDGTRAVEYALDTTNGELVFQREFRLGEQEDQGGPGGHAKPMANGDWLVSWSNAPPQDNSAVQVDAETDTTKLEITIEHIGAGAPGNINTTRMVTNSPVALAARVEPLVATFHRQPEFHVGADDRPTVIVAFNQPVAPVTVTASISSVTVTGATVAVAPHIEAGAPAHAYAFTLTPSGNGEIRFALNPDTDQVCSSDEICTAAAGTLQTVPAEIVIPGPVSVAFGAGPYSVTEDGTVDISVTLNQAHGRSGDVAIPLAVAGTATRPTDYTLPTSVTFGPTETSKTVTLAARTDLLVEGDETVELEFGTLPAGVSAGSPATSTVTIGDATADTIHFRPGRTEVAEGNALDLTFSAGAGVTFRTAQTITLTLSGTATAGSDYTLSVGGRTLSSPYTLTLPVDNNAVVARLTIVDDPTPEGAEMLTVSAARGTTAIGSQDLTIPASDGDLPKVSIQAATSGSPAEGTALAFTLHRTGAITATLPVVVSVSQSGAMLTATPLTPATFDAGSATATLSVPTDDDQVVEESSVVTAGVGASASYEIGVPQAASVTVRDNDRAIFALTVDPEKIVEGETADVKVAITNGVTFADKQTIRLAFPTAATDTAKRGEDYTVAAETLTLPAGDREVTTTFTAGDDDDEEGAETLRVGAEHGTTAIDSRTLTIKASDMPPTIGISAPPAAVAEGAEAVFTLTRTKETEPDDLPVLEVTVSVTDGYIRLTDTPPTGEFLATVEFGADATEVELPLATEDDTVILMDPNTGEPLATSVVTVTVEPAEAQTSPAYTVAADAGTARVEVTEDDTATFALSVDKTDVAEGEEARVTVSITNGVTFSETQTITLFAQDTGTAVLGNGGAVGGDYTVHNLNGDRERDHIRLRRNMDSATATIRVRDDARAEAAETIRLAVHHPATNTDIGTPQTLTIAASDPVGRLQRAAIAGARLTLTFEEVLDAANPPPLDAFTVKAGPSAGPLAGQVIEQVTVSERTVVLHLPAAVPSTYLVRVSYTDPTAADDGAALQNTTGADVESWQDEPVQQPRRPVSRPPGSRGGGGAPAEDPPVPEPVGYLENPGPESFQSGVGVISGWVCEAAVVEVEVETESGVILHQVAAYGTERLDTEPICGDTDNGFGLLFNWNRLEDGEHRVVATVDGVELGRATFTVTTLGAEFVRDVAGECVVENFPLSGETVPLRWQQNSQNFVLAEGQAPRGTNHPGSAGVGYLENPGPSAFQSGIGILSGWVCEAAEVEIAIGALPVQVAAYGTERLDTETVCGDTDNGFGLLFNWNRLGAGEHEVVAYVDGVELGRATVQVTTLGHEFLRGAEGECVVANFPMPGETVTLEWQQNSQNFVITDRE